MVMSVLGAWRRSLSTLLNLVLESPCPLCQRTTPTILCLDCQRQLERCQYSSFTPPSTPSSAPIQVDECPVLAWGRYDGTMKRAIAALKYANQPQLGQPLGQLMGQMWLNLPAPQRQQVLVVPIPLHADKLAKRGFNQAELLAESFCQITGLPLCAQGLVRQRSTAAQFGLSLSDRDRNLAGAFQVDPDLAQRRSPLPVLLLDDIYTTGATARAAIHTLRQQRIPVYGIAALARPSFSQDRP